MFGLKRSSKRAEYGILIEISSGSVGIGVVESKKTEDLPRLIFSHRIHMRIQKNDLSPQDLLRHMRETLFSASLILSKDGLQKLKKYNSRAKISRIFLVASAPWAYTVSREVEYEDDHEFKVTQELIDDLIASAERESGETFVGTIPFERGYEVVERATVDVRINGYSIGKPLDLTGVTLSLSHVTGYILADIVDAVAEVRDKIFTETDIQAHTSMLISYCVFRDLFPKTNDLALLHVTGEATEMGIVEKGVLIETHSTLYGHNSLIREIVQKTNQTPEHIVSMFRAFTEGNLGGAGLESVTAYADLYDTHLRTLFQTAHESRSIPRTMIINADPSIAEFINARVVKNIEEVTSQTFTILHIKKETLEHIALDEDEDLRIALIGRFFHKLHGCGDSVDDYGV